MLSSFLRVTAAVGLFGVVHSLLASRQAKKAAAHWLGERQGSGLYRVFYIGQSFVTIAALLAYIYHLPDRTIYQVSGLWAALLRIGQAAGLVFATAAAYQVGLLRITGLRSLIDWLRGERRVAPTPEAQGPAPEGEDLFTDLRVRGPFRITRHPLNLSPLPVFWLTPRMTVKRLAFNLVSTLYLVLGSIHEEDRLRAAYGDAYRAYQHSGVPFYLPVIKPR